MRETFGRYVDPRVVEGLIDRQSLAASDGERRVMTVLFCDMKGFTSLSEGMTPQGLVKVMNHYLSTMSGPIRSHRGIIDKYIGDAIMAYWGPPFTEDGEQARLACLAAIDMADRGAALADRTARIARRAHGAERLRRPHRRRDRRGAGRQHRLGIHDELHGDGRRGESGLAAGGRQQDLRQPLRWFRSRRSRRPAMRSTFREIDRLVVVGQTHPEAVFEIMGRKDELDAGAIDAAGAVFGRARRLSRAPLGRGASRPSAQRSKRSPATGRRWRWSSASRTFRPTRRPPIGTARGVSIRSDAPRRVHAAENPARRRKIPAAPVRTSSGACPGSRRSARPEYAPPARARSPPARPWCRRRRSTASAC